MSQDAAFLVGRSRHFLLPTTHKMLRSPVTPIRTASLAYLHHMLCTTQWVPIRKMSCMHHGNMCVCASSLASADRVNGVVCPLLRKKAVPSGHSKAHACVRAHGCTRVPKTQAPASNTGDICDTGNSVLTFHVLQVSVD